MWGMADLQGIRMKFFTYIAIKLFIYMRKIIISIAIKLEPALHQFFYAVSI